MNNDNLNSNILSMQDDLNQDETFMPENFIKSGVPFLTKYETLFGKSPFWIVKDEKFTYVHFNHIQLSFFYFIFQILLLSSFFIWKYVAYDFYFKTLNSYFCFVLTMYIIVALGLFRTILTNPYLPFFYPAQKDRKTFTQTEYRQGFAYKPEQIKWAKKQEKPNRSTFSSTVGYFVIRADHYCVWVRNWIGYKNHRFFLIFTTFSAIYMDTIFINFCHFFIFHFKACSFFCHAFCLSTSGFFSYVFTVQTLYQYYHVSINKLLLENLKGQNRFYDRGCLNNWSEICGPKKLICLWPWPCITLKTSYNPFNYPEYVGPSTYKEEDDNDDKKDEDDENENLFNRAKDDDNNTLL